MLNEWVNSDKFDSDYDIEFNEDDSENDHQLNIVATSFKVSSNG